MNLTISCPGCHNRRTIAPGFKYMSCDRCGTPHCAYCGTKCKVEGCSGWMTERRHA